MADWKQIGIISGVVLGTTALFYFAFTKRYRIANFFRRIRISENGKTMDIVLKRTIKGDNYTIGELSINGTFFCYTLEDKDRGLTDNMSESEIKRIKVDGATAIPTGTYILDMNTVSPRFSEKGSKSQYISIGNKLPRLLNVKGFIGILFHIGNYITDTDGCLLVGSYYNKEKGTISDSKNTFFELYEILADAEKQGKEIKVTIR
jgi:hypothetical protein